MESKCNDQAAGLCLSIPKAITEACTAPVEHIKAVRESCAGYTFTVIAWKIEEIKKSKLICVQSCEIPHILIGWGGESNILYKGVEASP